MFRSLEALFPRFGGGRGMLLEANMSQTIGSASSSLAAGAVTTASTQPYGCAVKY